MPRGKKICPECGAPTGPRTTVCQCGHHFQFAEGKAPKTCKTKATRPPEQDKLSPGVTAEDAPEIVQISDRQALDSFIESLKMCRTDSNRNGGCFSAFLHHKHGTLQVEVWVPLVLHG